MKGRAGSKQYSFAAVKHTQSTGRCPPNGGRVRAFPASCQSAPLLVRPILGGAEISPFHVAEAGQGADELAHLQLHEGSGDDGGGKAGAFDKAVVAGFAFAEGGEDVRVVTRKLRERRAGYQR